MLGFLRVSQDFNPVCVTLNAEVLTQNIWNTALELESQKEGYLSGAYLPQAPSKMPPRCIFHSVTDTGPNVSSSK